MRSTPLALLASSVLALTACASTPPRPPEASPPAGDETPGDEADDGDEAGDGDDAGSEEAGYEPFDESGEGDEEPLCDEYDDFEEGGTPSVAIRIEDTTPVGVPVFGVDCAGFTDASCDPVAPLLCGIDGTGYALVRDEGRVPIIVQATERRRILIDGQVVDLAPARSGFEGRIVIDVRARLDDVVVQSYDRLGSLDLPWRIELNEARHAAGTLSLSGFGGLVRQALDGAPAPADDAAEPPGVLVIDDEEIVGAVPADLASRIGDVRHLVRFDGDLAELCVAGKTRALGPRLVVIERATRRELLSRPLPKLPAGAPCALGFSDNKPSVWPLHAYADIVADTLAPHLPRRARLGGELSFTGGWSLFGAGTPSVAALFGALQRDRLRLATLLGDGLPGVRVKTAGQRVTSLAVDDVKAAASLTSLGVDAALARLIGAAPSAADVLFGVAKSRPTGPSGAASYQHDEGPIRASAYVTITEGAITRVSVSWADRTP